MFLRQMRYFDDMGIAPIRQKNKYTFLIIDSKETIDEIISSSFAYYYSRFNIIKEL